jgi:hypothetical protein
MHLPVTLLRWAFGPQPPNAKAGVTADDTTTERMTTPSSVAKDFFMENLPFACDDRAEHQQVNVGRLTAVARRLHLTVRQPEPAMNATLAADAYVAN